MTRLRDYTKIQKEIAVNGFFSEYLPPCFKIDERVLYDSPGEHCDLIPPISFTMSRFTRNNARRTIHIPEIGAHIACYNYIRDNTIIKELIEFSERNKHSFSKDIDDNNEVIRYDQIYNELINYRYIEGISNKIILSAGAKKVLKLDIANCFSSFYLHMMPAIFLGAETAQEEFIQHSTSGTASTRFVKYSKFEAIVRRQNLNRTNGLLVGPLLSKIIVEALLTRVDMELESKGYNFIRYMDDYEFFLYEDTEKEIINNTEFILKKYGFSLNTEKSEIVEFPYYVVENFSKVVNCIPSYINNPELIDIFTYFINSEQKGTKGAIRYLAKIFPHLISRVNEPSFKLGTSYLLTMMANDERSLPKVCELFVNSKDKFHFSENDIQILKNLLKFNLKYRNDLEVFWLIYMLSEINQIINDENLIEDILHSGHELAWVILLKYGILNDSQKSYMCTNALTWLSLYELFSEGMISDTIFFSKLNIDKNRRMYDRLKSNNIHFINASST